MPKKRAGNQNLSTTSNQGLATSRYSKFLRGLELIAIALTQNTFRINRPRYFEDPEQIMKVSWSGKPLKIKEDHFDVEVDFEITVGPGEKGRRNFELQAKYIAHLHSAVGPEEEFVRRFSESEIRIIVWPFFREYLIDVSSKMHIPPITLPLAVAKTETEMKFRRYK